MKLDDTDPDYFLHDFSKGEATPEGSEGTQTSGGPTIDITGQGSGNPGVPKEPRRRRHRGWIWFLVILGVAFGVFLGVRYWVPYVKEARVAGYVTSIEKRGLVFGTFEGEMIQTKQLTDTNRIYQRDFTFSVPSDSIARLIQHYEAVGHPVTLTVERYYGKLPWRGDTKNIVIGVEPNHNLHN